MNEIHYSKLAYNEGYDFSTLPLEQQQMTCRLYGGVEYMEDLYRACAAYEDYREGTLHEDDFSYTWGFPQSGGYSGIIMHCERFQKKNSWGYTMHVLMNDSEVKFIKFKSGFSDPVYKAIRQILHLRLGEKPYFEDLYGRIISLEIKNITESSVRKYDKPYSVITNAEILTDAEDDTVCAMFELMLEQSNNNEGTDEGG